MKNTKDSPGVFIPPPLFYAAFFLLSIFLQRWITIQKTYFFHTRIAVIIGLLIVLAGLFLAIPALRQFMRTKNTIVPVKAATSLQTDGIYSFSRNPMYVGLLLIYAGLAFVFGNWWTLLLIPVLITAVQYFIIIPEERYLTRAFGENFVDYQKKVRRWI